MRNSRNLFSGRRMYIFGFVLLSFIAVVCAAFSWAGNDGFDIARREILLRKIGHELLLQSGDSISRVLPVKKIAENEYLISFENDFTFQPYSLMNTTRRLLAKDPLASDCVVNVLNCANSTIAYGYAVSKHKADNIVACGGRKQPNACYTINIKFKPGNITTATNGYFLGSLSFLAFGSLIFLRYVKPRKTLPASQNTEQNTDDMLTLGSVLFDSKNRKLIINDKSIVLTGTESRLLLIFALSPNETIERSRLQKEIWEDAGIIVGRSLDMFISKLRKKLEIDPDINIVVIRSKGYKLEVKS